MAKSQSNIIWWIIGIIIFIIIIVKLPISPWFAIVTKVTCMDNTISYFDLDGNVLDSQGINNGVNYGATFVPGKIGQGIQFNTTTYVDFPVISSEDKTIVMWIKDYSDIGSDWYFASEVNGTAGANQIILLGPDFGLNFNGSVDEIAVFDKLLTSSELSNLSSGIKVCYTISYEENVSCKDYATEQVTDPGAGCLNYSGDFFPNCEYEWVNTSQYEIENNLCGRYFYCQNPCLTIGNCYTTEQLCTESLVYDCYLMINNQCVHKTDYANCITNTSRYENLTTCQANLTVTTPSITTPTDGTTIESVKDKLSKPFFEIAGYEIKLWHLIIALALIIIILYYTGAFRKK